MSQTDGDYEAFIKENPETRDGQGDYERSRAARQLGHYTDSLTVDSQSSSRTQSTKKKPSKSEMKVYKKRKEDRKKRAKKWLYE